MGTGCVAGCVEGAGAFCVEAMVLVSYFWAGVEANFQVRQFWLFEANDTDGV